MKRILLMLALAGAGTAHAESKTFKDWTVVCDNTRACAAFGFSAMGEGDIAYVRVSRGGAAGAAPQVRLAHSPDAFTSAGPWRLAIDGQPLPTLSGLKPRLRDDYEVADLAPAQAAALVAALRAGTALSLNDGKADVGVVSLAGSAAALLWMDDQQKRVGAVTALSKPGDRPVSTLPPPPAPPVLAPGPPVTQAGLPRRTPPSVTARLKDIADCTDPLPEAEESAVIARLAPGVVLYGPVCDRAAYNELNAFFLGDEKGAGLRAVDLPLPPPSLPAQVVMNVAYDPATRVLTSVAKGRGLGDCGDITQWVWDGAAFRLLSQRTMVDCRGAAQEDWPSLYVARLK